MDIVKAISAVEAVTNGGTKPYVLMGENGQQYYVKFKENPESARILINEYICGEIAALIGLPITENVLIEIDQQFIDIFGEEIEEHIWESPSPGLHFGSLKINDVYLIEDTGTINEAKNIDCLPTILLFDHLIGNNDRESNKGNILITGKKEIYAIDHSNAFEIGPLWDAHQLDLRLDSPISLLDMNGYVYSKWTDHISDPNPFSAFFDNLPRLTDDVLWNIIDSTPEEWAITPREKEKLLAYISFRRDNIVEVPELLRDALPYWKGDL